MPSEKEVYARHAVEYEALVSREDYQGNILSAIHSIVPPDGLDVLDLGAGTGRLACLLQPLSHSVIAFDLSPHMLSLARERLQHGPHNWLAAAADHRYLPIGATSADLIVSGWSVSYLTVWYPEHWREQADAWFGEARRVLRPTGHIILFESLGTGNAEPQRLAHLENFYRWLDEKAFNHLSIRTDYRFDSTEQATEIAGFFFGDQITKNIPPPQPGHRAVILPECTGVWWLHV